MFLCHGLLITITLQMITDADGRIQPLQIERKLIEGTSRLFTADFDPTNVLSDSQIDSNIPTIDTHEVKKRHADSKSSSETGTLSLEDNDDGCICVPRDECDSSNRTITMDLDGLIDARTRTCDDPNDVLCGCKSDKHNHKDEHHSHKNTTSSTYESKYSKGSQGSNFSSSYSHQEYTNKGGIAGLPLNVPPSNENYNCFCKKESTSSTDHETGHHGTEGHHGSGHDHHGHGSQGHGSHGHDSSQNNEGTISGAYGPSEEMHCVCKRKISHSSPHQATGYGHNDDKSGNKESFHEKSEELQCVCQSGHKYNATHWSYGYDTGSSHNINGHHGQTSGTGSSTSDSYSYLNTQSSTGTNYGQQGNTNKNEGITGTTYQHSGSGTYGQEHSTIKDGITGTTSSYSYLQTSDGGNEYMYSTEDNKGDLHHNTGTTVQDTSKYSSGATSTSNSYSHSHSQSSSHYSGEENHGLNTGSQYNGDKTSTTKHTLDNTHHGEHDHTSTTGTHGNSGSSYTHSNSQSESHSTGEIDREDSQYGHTTDKTGYDQHQYTVGISSTTGATASYSASHSQSQAHSSEKNEHEHSLGHEDSSSSAHQHTDDKKHGSTIKDTAHTGTGTTNSYSYSHSESQSSGGISHSQEGHSHDKDSSTSTSHENTHDKNENQHGHTSDTGSSNTGTYSSHTNSESHTGSDYGQSGHSHGQEDNTSSSHHHNEENIHGEHKDTSATSSGTTSSYSYSQSHSGTQTHSQGDTSYGQGGHTYSEDHDKNTSQKPTDESNGHHGHETGVDSSSSTSSSQSHSVSQSQSSDKIGYGGDAHSNSQGSSTSSYGHSGEKEHGQNQDTSGSTGTTNSYSQSQSQATSSAHSVSYGQDGVHQESGTDISQQHTDENNYSQQEHISGNKDDTSTSNSYSHSQSGSHAQSGTHSQSGSHSQSSEGTKYGQDGNTHTEESNTGLEYSGTGHEHSSTGSGYGQTHGSEHSTSDSNSHFHNGSQSSSGSYGTSHGSSESTSHGEHGYNNNKDYNHTIAGKPIDYERCGYRRDADIAQRIKSDDPDSESLFGQFPWMVAILIKSKNPADEKKHFYRFVCGGSLLHEKVVLTATHCIVKKDIKTLAVRAGEWNAQASDELLPHQQEDVEKVIRHPDYYSGGLYNDVSLIIIKNSFSLADNVDVVCLPPPTYNIDYSEKCVVSGWGKDSLEKNSEYQPILRQVELPLIQREHCQEKLRKTRLGQTFNLHRSFICAGGELNKDTCKGDGGGPLVCPVKGSIDRYQQVGIVSWGIGCGSETPAVYVNVKSYTNWIDEQMNKLNLKRQYYYK